MRNELDNNTQIKIIDQVKDDVGTIEKSEIKIGSNGNGETKKILNDLKYEMIHVTTNYDQFKLLEFNRDISKNQLKRLTKVMGENGFIPAFHVVCNDNFEIIDGQHRWAAAKELGIPVYYCFSRFYSPELVIILNNSGRKWVPIDYMNFFVYFKCPEYLKLEKFIEKYNIPISPALAILSWAEVGGANTTNFQKGKFFVKDRVKSEAFADFLIKFKNYKFYKSQRFIMAIWKIYKLPKFKPSHLLKNLSIYPEKLDVKAASAELYCQLLEWVYNANLTKNEKLSFRNL